MHRIHSWAKAHAFPNRSLPSDSPPQNQDSQSHNAASPGEQNAHMTGRDRNPQPAGSSQHHDPEKPKPSRLLRLKHGVIRFGRHAKTTLLHSWLNVLLVFVPVGIAVEAAHMSPTIIFSMNAIAIVPLASLLSHATECVASRMGDTIGALTNVTFGNAVELIIMIIALAKNEIRIVQASLLGSILANLLLIMGMAFLLGGLRFQEQTAFHASWSNTDVADRFTIKVSRGTSVVLLLVYILYIVFQLKSHAYLYESTPQQIIDEESHPGVLAEFMNSSDSSSSSSDESLDTLASWSTAKRLKKVMKYRRRRKSSTSSKGTASRQTFRRGNRIPSDIPPILTDERPASVVDSGGSHPDEKASSAIDFCDDSRHDADDEARTFNGPRSRDFGQAPRDSSASKHRKDRGRGRKRQKIEEKVAKKTASRDAPAFDLSPRRPSLKSHLSEPCIGSIEHSMEVLDDSMPERKSSLRRNIPSMFSNTIFSNTQAPSGNTAGIQRSNSMPVRMNRTPVVGNAVQYARGAAAAETKDTESSPESKEPDMSRTASVVLLLVSTGLVAACAEFLVGAIPEMVESSSVSQEFIGLIILPVVSNAAEHVTAVLVATKNKMDLSIGVSVGSSIQIAIFVTPLIVIIGWCIDKEMSLYFTLFETICLFVTAFVVNFLVLDGRSNYLEGTLLLAAYVIIALGAFYYPDSDQVSEFSGAG
ncbi:transporter [Aspergillus sp. HF37]|nr:transporter [Aspergillus sp. HF37]